MSLSVDAPAAEYTRADALFELTDALLCSDGLVKTLVELSLAGEHRRGHDALYAAVDRGWTGADAVMSDCRAERRIVLAVDVSNWLRPDAPASDDRLFCHVYGRGDCKTDRPVPGGRTPSSARWRPAAPPGSRCWTPCAWPPPTTRPPSPLPNCGMGSGGAQPLREGW
ncbi:transposase [Streptomyces sp. NPDC013313]|uniref:transposase n=1 Tax=Streptomyces sp. NPDC013313 TaxID=3155603 RepID=UPI00340990A8